MSVESTLKPGRAEMWLRIMLVIMSVVSLFGFVHSVSAAGSTQISGTGHFDTEGICNEPITNPAGLPPDFAVILEGDLEGCLYTWVETSVCRPSGTYKETGTETFVGRDDNGNVGKFSTTFVFTAKYEDCANLGGQIFGRCQHPIETGSGSGDFTGVRGRLDFKDNVELGNASYRGHLKF